MHMRIGGVQLSASTGALEDNLASIEASARSAKAQYPDLSLLAFPELATTGYQCGAAFHELAVSWPNGGYLPRLGALAKELECVLVVGFAERLSAYGLTADSAAVIDSDGQMLGSYRKAHCLDRERQWFVNGSSLPVFDTAAGRLGVLICWDAAMPEAARTYALKGASLLVAIGAWEDPYVPDWSLVCSARAYDNVIPLLGVNRTGSETGASFSGGSRVVDCLGKVLASRDDERDGLVTGVIETGQMEQLRSGYGSQLRDRRPDLYHGLIKSADDVSWDAEPPSSPTARERPTTHRSAASSSPDFPASPRRFT